MLNYISDKVILITGGTGSWGQKFTEMALTGSPRALRILSRGEYLQWEMAQKFKHDPRLSFFIGDVRDKDRLKRAMHKADIVIHAAALKQVPICEYNPREAIYTNVLGAINVMDAAIDSGVEEVMAISTDKSAAPYNLYGATKLCMEKLIVQANVYSGYTRFSCVRYGNVVGSRGSVIQVFLEQKHGGYITITDPRMTRFWMTLSKGVEFVLKSLELMSGGEVFVPKLPSVRITDLADVIAPRAERVISGIRPGEKLEEVLITENESSRVREYSDYYIIEPEFPFWGEKPDIGPKVSDGFRYSSGTNIRFLEPKEIDNTIKELDYDSIGAHHKNLISALESQVKHARSKNS